MGFGADAAKGALNMAVDAIKAIAEVKAIVQQLQLTAQQHEQRTNAHIANLETRIRELERELAKVAGTVNGGFAEAIKVVLLEPRVERSLEKRADADCGPADEEPKKNSAPISILGES